MYRLDDSCDVRYCDESVRSGGGQCYEAVPELGSSGWA